MAKFRFKELWFGKINPESAHAVINELKKGWYVLAGLQALGQALLIWLSNASPANPLDVGICAFGGYFLASRKSRDRKSVV